MRILANTLWIIFGGFLSSLGWIISGCLWCVTIVGIPVGMQCFKLSSISLNPFGKEIEYDGGSVSFLMNVLWFLFSGMELAAMNFLIGVLPFGKQYFKIAKLALAPFGATVVRTNIL